MIAVTRIAIATAAFATLGTFVALMPTQASAQGINGNISFAVSLMPHGFKSNACQNFQVIAEEPTGTKPSLTMEVIGKTTGGKMTASVKGSTVECAYSVEMLQVPRGQVTVQPSGAPLGYKAPATYQGSFNPTARSVNGKKCRPTCSFSNVNFVFENIGIPR
jgi:hypothetical protein